MAKILVTLVLVGFLASQGGVSIVYASNAISTGIITGIAAGINPDFNSKLRYHAQEPGVVTGYEDLRMGTDRYQVYYEGNNQYELERLRNYLLYRFAELALKEGYHFFVVECSDVHKLTEIKGYNQGFVYAVGVARLVNKKVPAEESHSAKNIIEKLGKKYEIERRN